MTIDWIEVRCPCCRTLLLIALPAMKGPGSPRCEECGADLASAAPAFDTACEDDESAAVTATNETASLLLA